MSQKSTNGNLSFSSTKCLRIFVFKKITTFNPFLRGQIDFFFLNLKVLDNTIPGIEVAKRV